MGTLNQLVSNLRNSTSQGRGNRGQTFTNRQLEFWIKQGRNFLLSAQVTKDQTVNPLYEQDLGCLTLTTVDRSECASYGWMEDVKKVVLPKVLDLSNNMGIPFFGLIDKRTRIYLPDMNYGSLNDLMRYKPKNNMEAMIVGETVYVMGVGVEKLCVVNARVLAEDPTLVKYYSEQGIERCYDPDKDEYPMPTNLEGALFTWIDQTYINPKVQFPASIQDNEAKQTVL